MHIYLSTTIACHPAPRPLLLSSPRDRPRVCAIELPRAALPRAEGKRDWRCVDGTLLTLGFVDTGGFSTKEVSVVLRNLVSCAAVHVKMSTFFREHNRPDSHEGRFPIILCLLPIRWQRLFPPITSKGFRYGRLR